MFLSESTCTHTYSHILIPRFIFVLVSIFAQNNGVPFATFEFFEKLIEHHHHSSILRFCITSQDVSE